MTTLSARAALAVPGPGLTVTASLSGSLRLTGPGSVSDQWHDGCFKAFKLACGRIGLSQPERRGGGTLPAAPGCTAACLPLALSTGPALHPDWPGR